MSTHEIAAAGAPSIDKTTWRIDPDRSSVEFNVKNFWGLQTVKGRFSRYQGTLDLSRSPAVELTIEAGSLDTENEKRDKHLSSPDFFDVERHPYVRFVAYTAAVEGERLYVRGVLHARGARLPLDVDARLRRVGDELELEAVAAADHRQLGMTWNMLGVVRSPSKLVVKGRLVGEA